MDFGTIILTLPALIFSVVFHEVSHGWVAEKNGDPTARMMGRITLNPIPHVDPWGSLLLPGILMALNTGFLFGYAKPVPVELRNLRNPRIDGIKVAIVGPFSNLLLALVSSVLLGLSAAWLGQGHALTHFFVVALGLNVTLALFNLLPIPPLDGSWVLEHSLRGEAYETYRAIRPYGMFLLIGVLIFPPLTNLLLRAPQLAVLGWFYEVANSVLRMVS
jgi:Zn-dependent protease